LIAAAVLSSGCEQSSGGQGSVSGSDSRRADRRGDERPLLDPDVVGPRLVRESFGPQLLFWLRTYRARGAVACSARGQRRRAAAS
jgi:hypothetical protein